MADSNIDDLERSMRKEAQDNFDAETRRDNAQEKAAEEEAKNTKLNEEIERRALILAQGQENDRKKREAQDKKEHEEEQEDRKENKKERKEEEKSTVDAMKNAASDYYGKIHDAFKSPASAFVYFGLFKFIVDFFINGAFSSFSNWPKTPSLFSFMISVCILGIGFFTLVLGKLVRREEGMG